MRENRFIASLTGLRFVAAATVAVGHGAPFLRHDWLGELVAQISSIGMTLFFVLSGFVLWLNYAAAFASKPFAEALREFAIARFARLYPMYAFVVLATVVWMIAWKGAEPRSLAFVLTMTQAWFPTLEGRMLVTVMPLVQHLWSISVELFFYLLFPFACVSLLDVQRRATILLLELANLVLFAMTISAFFSHGEKFLQAVVPSLTEGGMQWLTYYAPYLHASQFFAGCFAAMLFCKLATKPVSGLENKVALVLFWTSITGLLLTPALLFFQPMLPGYHFAIELAVRLTELVFFSVILLGVSRYRLGSVLSWPAVVLAGECSYSIYILHPFLIKIAMIRQSGVMAVPEFVFRLCLFVVVTSAVAWCTYSVIEAPSRAWIRRVLGSTAPREVLRAT